MNWIDASKEKSEAGRPVLVSYIDNERQKWARACWIPKGFEEDTGNYCGEPDYDEANDTCYWPQGWYEWNAVEETHWQLDGEITHWAAVELPHSPEQGQC